MDANPPIAGLLSCALDSRQCAGRALNRLNFPLRRGLGRTPRRSARRRPLPGATLVTVDDCSPSPSTVTIHSCKDEQRCAYRFARPLPVPLSNHSRLLRVINFVGDALCRNGRILDPNRLVACLVTSGSFPFRRDSPDKALRKRSTERCSPFDLSPCVVADPKSGLQRFVGTARAIGDQVLHNIGRERDHGLGHRFSLRRMDARLTCGPRERRGPGGYLVWG